MKYDIEIYFMIGDLLTLWLANKHATWRCIYVNKDNVTHALISTWKPCDVDSISHSDLCACVGYSSKQLEWWLARVILISLFNVFVHRNDKDHVIKPLSIVLEVDMGYISQWESHITLGCASGDMVFLIARYSPYQPLKRLITYNIS